MSRAGTLPLLTGMVWLLASPVSAPLHGATPATESISAREQQEGALPPASQNGQLIIEDDLHPLDTAETVASILDQARLLHMEGASMEAIRLLEEMPVQPDTEEDRDRLREMMAFLLASVGEHARAFDSLHLLHLSTAERAAAERAILIGRHEESLQALRSEAEAAAAEDRETARLLHEQNRLLLIAIAALALLLSIAAVLLIRRTAMRTRQIDPKPSPPPGQRTEPAPPAAPVPAQTPARTVRPSAVQNDLLDHIERLSALVNGGSTVEAAVHLDIFKRYLRMVAGMKDGWLPLQDSVSMLRQFLKLSSMRSSARMRYAVDVHGSLRDAAVQAPAGSLLNFLQAIMPEVLVAEAPTAVVEFSRHVDADSVICTIRWSSTSKVAEELMVPVTDESRVILRHLPAEGQEKALEVEWR
jgi:hypothetical protein